MEDVQYFKSKEKSDNQRWVCRELMIRKLPQGELIMHNAVQRLYVIIDGLVGIYVNTAESIKEQAKLTDCDCFGSLTGLDSLIGSYSALSLSDSIVAVLSNESF